MLSTDQSCLAQVVHYLFYSEIYLELYSRVMAINKKKKKKKKKKRSNQ